MKNRDGFFHLHLISDATGETLITVARAAAAQYDGGRARSSTSIRWSARRAQLDRVIAATRGEARHRALHAGRRRARRPARDAPAGASASPASRCSSRCCRLLQSYLGAPGARRVGAQHVLDADYFRRIDALNFTMIHDDGQLAGSLEDADVVLVGISRTSKTPTSIYLANRGIKTANIPIVPGIPPPAELETRQAAAGRRPDREPRAHRPDPREPRAVAQRRPPDSEPMSTRRRSPTRSPSRGSSAPGTAGR